MSIICDLLKKGWTFEDFEKLNIKVTKENNYALFKYSIEADFSNPIVQEARGIIIDLDRLVPVCFPFVKFGNYGEPYVPEIDWKTARVQEKIDGSIIKLWYHCGWHFSTNGCIDAFTTENAEGMNFGIMAAAALREQNPELFIEEISPLNKDYTYMFELVSPDNQIVVQYPKTEVYHIGSRNNVTEKEEDLNIGIQKPKEYNLSSLDECIEFANTFKGTEHEGFVVVDANWNRIKVKSEDYLRLHYMAGNGMLSLSNALDIIMNDEIEEYCTYFPNKREKLEGLKQSIEIETEIIKQYIERVKVNKDKLSRKDFALMYKNSPYFGFYMSVLFNDKELIIPKKYWENFFKYTY